MRAVILFATLFLTGCGTTSTPSDYFARNHLPAPTLAAFPHCRGYGCAHVESVHLPNRDWMTISRLFPAHDADDERKKVARAIGLFEQRVGIRTGTSEDVAGTYTNPGPYQLDCVDESTNTTVYLTLLQQRGWLKFHDVMAPDTRVPYGVGIFVAHRTAVMRDKRTGMRYAVDSWFHDNGIDAEIVPVNVWKKRWHPGDPV
jgi:hypothetical protein